jgi:threonine dehydratase
LVPVSGGGLIAGIALAVKSRRPDVRLVGVCAERAPAMFDSVRAGHPVASVEHPTLADSLRGGVGAHNRWTFDLVRRHVDDLVTVSDEQIRDALAYALYEQGLVLEGAAVVGIAALLHGKVAHSADPTAVLVSGRNTGVDELFAAIGV